MEDEFNSEDILSKQLPEKVKELRDKFINYKVPEKDKYGDGFLAEVYLAAKMSETGSLSSIRKTLRLDNLTFDYYMNKYPDFVAAVHIGLYDSRKDKISDIEGSLLSRALGVEIEEERVEDSGALDEDGNMKGIYRKITKVKKQIPPDPSVGLAILGKIDPSWNPKSTFEINLNQTLNVTEDVNLNVDLRKLSPEALKEILASNKLPIDTNINKTPDGKSVRYLGEKGEHFLEVRKDKFTEYRKKKREEKLVKEEKIDKNVKIKKRVMSAETRAKISQALRNRNKKEVE